jgi:hypothetical protein
MSSSRSAGSRRAARRRAETSTIEFRVLDNGEPSEGVDRTTLGGFEGGGGIITSHEYCDARIWPDEDARTNAVRAGNIKIHR